MRRAVLLVILVVFVLGACGGTQPPPADNDDVLPDPGSASPGGAGPGGEIDDTGEMPASELERRQFAACERVIPRLTECAVADARANLSPEQLAELDLERTAPIHTRENLKTCKAQRLSSRQVRVYEVCDREETSCGPLVACLDHAQPRSGDGEE